MNTDVNRADVIATEHTITAQVDGQTILFKTKGRDWTVGEGAELGDTILAAATLLDFQQGKKIMKFIKVCLQKNPPGPAWVDIVSTTVNPRFPASQLIRRLPNNAQ